MNEHEINHMANSIYAAMAQNPKARIFPKEIKRALKKYWQNKAAIIWSVDDILNFAKEMDYEDFCYEDAIEVLDSVIKNHDAEYGLNWDIIEGAIHHHVEDRACT